MKRKRQALFLLDALGALVSAIVLGIVFVHIKELIGMPVDMLHFLALLASGFFIYSFACYLSRPKKWRGFMKAISLVNVAYSLLTVGLVANLYHDLTFLARTYFVVEILIVLAIAFLEWRKATETAGNPNV